MVVLRGGLTEHRRQGRRVAHRRDGRLRRGVRSRRPPGRPRHLHVRPGGARPDDGACQPAAAQGPPRGRGHQRRRRGRARRRRDGPAGPDARSIRPRSCSRSWTRSCRRSGAAGTRSTWSPRPAVTSGRRSSPPSRAARTWTRSSSLGARRAQHRRRGPRPVGHGRLRRLQPVGEELPRRRGRAHGRDRQAHHQRPRPSDPPRARHRRPSVRPHRPRHSAGGGAGRRADGLLRRLAHRHSAHSRPKDDA